MSKEKKGPAVRVSHSFTPGEIQILDFVLSTMLRGGTVSMAVRNKEFPSLCQKVGHMKKRLEEQRGTPLPPVAAGGEEGSGIVLRADDDASGPAGHGHAGI